ncbi:MAG: TfoX/Sxy family protein [Alphaproteobacteria bacterium]|nr:TfoX/Sxy family protein [Alphaproteobacteria bacterium]
MAVSAEFRDYVADLFATFGETKTKLMFGDAGIYFKDRMFGLIVDERIYLKANDETRAAFDAEGSKPFTFETKNGERMAMSYFELPSRLLDDPDELATWARRAYEVAIAAKGKKKSPAKKTAKPSPPRDLPLVSPRKKPRR